MFDDHSEKGVILSKLAYSEADEVITVLMEQSGIKRLFVRGARKSKKRFAGRIDHFQHFSFSYKNKNHGLPLLKSIEDLAEPQISFERDLTGFAFLSYLSELICGFYPEDVEAIEIYSLWQNVISDLRKEIFSIWQIVFYTLKLVEYAGYHFQPLEKQGLFMRDVEFSEKIQNKICQTLKGETKKKIVEILSYPQDLLEKKLKSLPFLVSLIDSLANDIQNNI